MLELITCPECGFKGENLGTHIKAHGMSLKDFKKKHNMKYVQSERIRNLSLKRFSENNPTKGKPRTAEDIKKISEAKTGKMIGISGTYERTPEIREKISKGVVKAHMRGDFDNAKPGNGSFVFCKKANMTVFARSTWEVALLEYFDKDPNINSVSCEPFTIPYMFEGSQHLYIPDYFVVYDEVITSIWEVKRDDFLLTDAKTIAKMSVLKNYCKANGHNMFIVNSEILKIAKKYIPKVHNGN